MAHQVSCFLFGVPGESKRVSESAASRGLVLRPLMSLLAVMLVLLPSLSGLAQATGATASTYVPPVVVSSYGPIAVPVPPLPTGQKSYGTGQGDQTPLYAPTTVSLDACGNVYTLDQVNDNGIPDVNNPGTNLGNGDYITEVPANGGFPTIVKNVGGYNNVGIGQDPLRKDLLVGQQYTKGNALNLIPLNNCVPNASQVTYVGNLSSYCYFNIIASTADFAGNYLIATNQAACNSDDYSLQQFTPSAGNILLTNEDGGPGVNFKDQYAYYPVAADLNQNAFFLHGNAGPYVFELPYASGSYAASPVQYGGSVALGSGVYKDPVGVSVDTNSNLYIVDAGEAAIYEIPYEVTPAVAATATTPAIPASAGLNPADEFVVTSNLTPAAAVPAAIDARGNIYLTPSKNYGHTTPIYKLSLGNAQFGSVPLGQTANVTVNFQFNAAVTPASVQLPTGAFGTANGGKGFPQCTAGTTYTPPAAPPAGQPQQSYSFCQVIATFTPTVVGKQSSTIVLADANGNSIATAYLVGVGQGALLTLDPATALPVGSGLKTPTGIAVDQVGNTYIADSANSSVTQFPVGGGAGVPLTVSVITPACGLNGTPSNPLALSAPTGVAVDGPGSVYIADTGNNRIVKVPFINGALSLSGATTVSSCVNGANFFSAPASIFVQTNGDLYITDTGNNRVVEIPNIGTGYGSPIYVATGLNAPLTATADAAGDVFIANSGDNTIVEVPLGGTTELVDAGVLNATSMATDASGALFVVDQGNFRVLRIPSTNGSLSVNNAAEVAFGVANPYGVTLDSSANLYVTDNVNAAAYVFHRTQVALAFGDLTTGSTSSILPLTVESSGTQPLIFTAPYDTATGDAGDFAVTSPTGACADSITLAPGSSCDLSATFTPTAAGARSETLVFNNNAAIPAQVLLSGTGMALASSTTAVAFTFAAGPNAPFYGEPLNFTATVTGSTPTGSVAFIVDGVQVSLLPLVGGVATLPLNSGLTGGGHSVYAVYKGDPANDGSSSAIIPITIARAPTTSSIVITQIPYNNPYSLRHSNAGSCDVQSALNSPSEPDTFPPIPNDAAAFLGSVTSPGVGIPSGTFTWYSDGKLINGPITANNTTTSISTVLPAAGNTFQGSISTTADSLGDLNTLGENNTLVSTHIITVVYSGDQNYLPSTSTGQQVLVVDVGPMTPVVLPETPIYPAPYCDPASSIKVSRPADPASFLVEASSTTVTSTALLPGSITLTFSSLGGYSGSIDLSCPNLPQYVTCTTVPGAIQVQSSTPGTTVLPTKVTLTFTTNVPPNIPTANQSRMYWLPSIVFGLALLYSRRRFGKFKNNLAVLGLALLLFGGMVGFTGCGSGTSSSSGATTTPGSYPITVVMVGSQTSYGPDFLNYNEVLRPDVPLNYPLTLTVK